MIERTEKIELAKVARDGIADNLRRMMESGRTSGPVFADMVASLAYYNGMIAGNG